MMRKPTAHSLAKRAEAKHHYYGRGPETDYGSRHDSPAYQAAIKRRISHTGTIKKHETYQDIKQTMLTRCKVEVS